MIYVDYMVVFSQYSDTHAAHLQEVFDGMRKYNLTLNPKKCVKKVGEITGLCVTSANGKVLTK